MRGEAHWHPTHGGPPITRVPEDILNMIFHESIDVSASNFVGSSEYRVDDAEILQPFVFRRLGRSVTVRTSREK